MPKRKRTPIQDELKRMVRRVLYMKRAKPNQEMSWISSGDPELSQSKSHHNLGYAVINWEFFRELSILRSYASWLSICSCSCRAFGNLKRLPQLGHKNSFIEFRSTPSRLSADIFALSPRSMIILSTSENWVMLSAGACSDNF